MRIPLVKYRCLLASYLTVLSREEAEKYIWFPLRYSVIELRRLGKFGAVDTAMGRFRPFHLS